MTNSLKDSYSKKNKYKHGFSAVELLITLFIAAAFLMSGYQLYAVVIKDGGKAHSQAVASNTVYDYIQRYKVSATDPCTAQTPLTDSSIIVSGLFKPLVTVAISCPYGTASSVSKVLVTINYDSPQQTVTNAVFINQSPSAPAEPTGLTAAGGSGQIVLNWTAPANSGGSSITGYRIYRGSTANSETTLTTVGNVITYTDTSLANNTTYYYKVAATNIVGDSAMSNEATATTLNQFTLAISAGANGTVNTAVNGNYSPGSTPTITATSNGGYIFSSWSGSTGCSGTTTASYTITMDNNKTCTANFTLDPNWITGIASTAMAGKYVRNADLGSAMQYKTTNDAVLSSQGSTGLDPNYSSNMSLFNPQTNPGVDFSAYPAQNACKAIGGRLPNMNELTAIFAGRVAYGNNFLASSGFYWSSTESLSNTAYGKYFNIGSASPNGKTGSYGVRCVMDGFWTAGIASTVMAGKYVRSSDLSSTYTYKSSSTSVISPQGATGLDPNYTSNMSLVSPQLNTGVDFTSYPAQNACKVIGGRLPNTQELTAIYAGQGLYGNNFQSNGIYWSSTEYGGYGAYKLFFQGGGISADDKTTNGYVRCISG